ncbi:MAG: aspartate 1-decarboxylase [Spirochaetes bacterium]|nr:aspartate 1-decarboxylase [Spirochaetota bacterium]
MMRQMLNSKIHRATVTGSDLNYVGSITIDEALMEAVDVVENQKVQIVNINNGSRFETYVIKGERDSGTICINGAAARLVHKGDLVIIIAYILVDQKELDGFSPKVVNVDEQNRIIQSR